MIQSDETAIVTKNIRVVVVVVVLAIVVINSRQEASQFKSLKGDSFLATQPNTYIHQITV
ncbi:hypothetical protein ATX57_06415 [Oenococcus oeni]|nr:hypothetical protein X467_02555 [Oenococcus oeni S28]KGH69245.1 hypothetical protein X286_03320 [Oenococcus oeni IOEB_9517]KGH73738.1 hypothetical protein X282_02795 [Oenococcus oeni IOEB_0608]OIK69048.1 hypothetical protein ATW67_09265 [Oenococcus oeni]OIK83520.1 hypothetical protein ATW76_05840 [Oenococcus oeni]